MKTILLIAILTPFLAKSQNQVHLFSGSGTPFMVLVKEKAVNATPQTHVLLRDVTEDTLTVKIEFNGRRTGITLFLLDKGKPADKKEFTYRVDPVKNGAEHKFMGMADISDTPKPLVPSKADK